MHFVQIDFMMYLHSVQGIVSMFISPDWWSSPRRHWLPGSPNCWWENASFQKGNSIWTIELNWYSPKCAWSVQQENIPQLSGYWGISWFYENTFNLHSQHFILSRKSDWVAMECLSSQFCVCEHGLSLVQLFMPWISVYHGERDMIQWTWYHVQAD